MPRPPKNLSIDEEEMGLWLQRLQDGEERVKEFRKASAAFRAAFEGEFPSPAPDEDDSELVHVNRVHRVVMQWIASLYAQNPRIELDPPWWSEKLDRRKIALDQSIMNAELRRVHLEEPVRAAVQTGLLDGWAWVKSGFHADWEYLAETLEEATSNAAVENDAFDYLAENPDAAPHDVLLLENHEEHLSRHRDKREQYEQQLQALAMKVRTAAQEAMAQGFEPLPTPPEVSQEVTRLQTIISAMSEHEALHRERQKERDETGSFPTNARVRPESCWTDYVHNSNVVWDLHATGTHDMRWLAERIIRPLEEFQGMRTANGRTFFKHTDEMAANFAWPKPGSKKGDVDESGPGEAVKSEMKEGAYRPGGENEDNPDALASIWKIWDIEHRRVIYIHDPIPDKPVRVEEWPHKFLRQPPLRMLIFEKSEDEFAPIPPVKYIWDQQLELNRYRTKAGIVTRRNSRVALADGRVPDEFITDIVQGRDASIHKVETVGVPIKDLFHVPEWGPVPVDIYQLSVMAQNDIEVDTGLGEVQLGSGVKAKTATAASIQRASLGVVLDRTLAAVERFVGEIASDLRGLMRQYYSTERYVELFWEGSKEMESWKGTDLEDMDIRVEMGSSRRKEVEVERMQWMEAMKLLMGIQGIDHRFLAERLLELLGVKNTAEAFIDMQTQGEPQMKPGPGPGQGQNQQEAPGTRGAGPTLQPAQRVAR